MIDLAILGVLKEHDLHGYELRKQLGELLGSRLAVSFGSIYPALAKLERAGSVKAVTHETVVPPSAPMSGSLAGELAAFRAQPAPTRPKRNRRGKKVYSITHHGEEQLHELLTAPGGTDQDFAVRLAFCHHLTAGERLALFERRRAEVVERRDQRRQADVEREAKGSHGQLGQRLNRYLRSLIEHDTEIASADLAWLDRLIAAERPAVAGASPQPGGHSEP